MELHIFPDYPRMREAMREALRKGAEVNYAAQVVTWPGRKGGWFRKAKPVVAAQFAVFSPLAAADMKRGTYDRHLRGRVYTRVVGAAHLPDDVREFVLSRMHKGA